MFKLERERPAYAVHGNTLYYTKVLCAVPKIPGGGGGGKMYSLVHIKVDFIHRSEKLIYFELFFCVQYLF